MRNMLERRPHRRGIRDSWGSRIEVAIGQRRTGEMERAPGETHGNAPLLGNPFPPVVRGVLETLGLIVAFVIAGLSWAAAL